MAPSVVGMATPVAVARTSMVVQASAGMFPSVVLTEEEMALYKSLTSEPRHVDEMKYTAEVFLNLELKGIIRQLPGKFYVKV